MEQHEKEDGMNDDPGSRPFEENLPPKNGKAQSQSTVSPQTKELYWKYPEFPNLQTKSSAEPRNRPSGNVVLRDNISPPPSFTVWQKVAVFAAMILLAASLFTLSLPNQPSAPGLLVPLATITGSEPGSEPVILKSGALTIDAPSLKEITFEGGTRVAIEGPASAELLSDSRMRLHSGKIGVDVPRGAEGFTLETPEGTIVDYGTRFGVIVGEQGGMRAEVFQGRIDVGIGETTYRLEGARSLTIKMNEVPELTPGSDPDAYPMPSSQLIHDLEGSFEGRGPITPQKPNLLEHWHGDYCEQVGPTGKVHPRAGSGMLQLIATGAQNQSSDKEACELWRIVDLDAIRKEMGRHPTRVHLSGWFNRIAGDAQTDTRFMISMATCESLEMNPGWEGAVPLKSRTEVLSDRDEETWEQADLQLSLKPATRYLAIMIGARENIHNDREGENPEFAGHFVDDISLTFSADLRSSLPEDSDGSEG